MHVKDHCVVANVETEVIAEFARNAYWHEVSTNSYRLIGLEISGENAVQTKGKISADHAEKGT
jgi:hypothetical protein